MLRISHYLSGLEDVTFCMLTVIADTQYNANILLTQIPWIKSSRKTKAVVDCNCILRCKSLPGAGRKHWQQFFLVYLISTSTCKWGDSLYISFPTTGMVKVITKWHLELGPSDTTLPDLRLNIFPMSLWKEGCSKCMKELWFERIKYSLVLI